MQSHTTKLKKRGTGKFLYNNIKKSPPLILKKRGNIMDYKYYIGKSLDAEDAENDNAKNMYLDQARGTAYNISNIVEREKALREIGSLR